MEAHNMCEGRGPCEREHAFMTCMSYMPDELGEHVSKAPAQHMLTAAIRMSTMHHLQLRSGTSNIGCASPAMLCRPSRLPLCSPGVRAT
jgi:hypothetical protein